MKQHSGRFEHVFELFGSGAPAGLRKSLNLIVVVLPSLTKEAVTKAEDFPERGHDIGIPQATCVDDAVPRKPRYPARGQERNSAGSLPQSEVSLLLSSGTPRPPSLFTRTCPREICFRFGFC